MTSLSGPDRLPMDSQENPSCPAVPGEVTAGSYFELPIQEASNVDVPATTELQGPTSFLSPSGSGDSTVASGLSLPSTPSRSLYASSATSGSGNENFLLDPEDMIELVEAELTAHSGMGEKRFNEFKSDLQAAVRNQYTSIPSGESRSQALQRSLTVSSINTGGFDTVEAVLKYNLAKFRQDCPDAELYIDMYVMATDKLVRSEALSQASKDVHAL